MTSDSADDPSYRTRSPNVGRARLLMCPKCRHPMEVATHEGVEIDRCAGCEGLWFDMLELERLREVPGSENLDSGDAAVGNQHNALDRIDCPVCQTRMIRMVDADQPHIWIEHCPSCHGVFLDAGELRDLKAKSPLDLLRWLRKGPRT